jgi:hypothetical protein
LLAAQRTLSFLHTPFNDSVKKFLRVTSIQEFLECEHNFILCPRCKAVYRHSEAVEKHPTQAGVCTKTCSALFFGTPCKAPLLTMRREGGAWTTSSSVGQRVSYLSLREQIKHALRRPRIVSRLWDHVKVRFGSASLAGCQRSSLYVVCRTLTAHTFFCPA